MAETSSAKLKRFNTKKFVCVEYPGYVKNVDEMLKTLGGEEQLSDTYFHTKRRIEIHFRPDDPYCHSVCGDLQSERAVILKVKRKRRKKKPDDEFENEWKYEQEVLGIVHQTYRFISLMDYQYLTPVPLQNSFTSIMTSNLLDEQQPLHIVPPIFSRIDVQGNYNYISEVAGKTGSKGKPMNEENDKEEHETPIEHTDTKIRKRRPSEAMGAIFSSKQVPKEPGSKCKETVNDLCKKYSWAVEAVEEIQALFNQRPIWSRSALVCHLSNELKRERLNKILPYFAFYWLNGPWRALWNRYGFDPRQKPEGKIYQTCDFRVRERKDGREIPISRFRNTTVLKLPIQVQRYRTTSATSVDYKQVIETKESSLRPEDLPYTFHADKLPRARQIMYQLCDIYDDDIQKVISERDGKEKTCRERSGWFPLDTIQRIRGLMSKKVEARIEKEMEERKERNLKQNEDSILSANEDVDVMDAENEEFYEVEDNNIIEYEENEEDI